MTVVTTQSTLVDNFQARPLVISDVRQSQARVKQSIARVAVAAGDDDGSIYLLMPVHSSWAITSIEVLNDGITGGSGYDLGLYGKDEVAVDDDAYASGVSMATARTEPAELAFEARDIALLGQAVWQDAGLSADPFAWYLLALTADTVGSVAGDIAVIVRYTTD